MNPISAKIDSGEEVNQATGVVNSCRMDKVKSIMNDKKTLYRNSAKLKSHIHSQVQDLIETLKERERQLFLEIDEHEVDCSVIIADQMTDVLLDTHMLSFDDQDIKMCSASLQKKLLQFVGNPELLKTQLQQFGKLEETGEAEATNGSSECIQQNSPKVKKLQLINGLMKRFSRRNGAKRMHRESSGSVESFEVIDGLDDEEYQKYFSTFKNEDDVVSNNSDEFQPWQPSFPVGETEFWNDTEQKQLHSPSPHVQEASEKDQQLAQSPDAMEVADPVMKINKQLQSLLQPMTDLKSKASQLDVPANNASSPLVQGVKSSGLSYQPPKTAPVPSAIVKHSLNKYLGQEDTRNWLVSSDGGLNGKNHGLDSLVSNFKGLHFKMC